LRYTIVPLSDHLRAELFERESAAETREFLNALAEDCLKHGSTRILVCVADSRPIFRIEDYQASVFLRQLAARATTRVALVAGHHDVRAAHEYLEVLARQQGASLRSFPDEVPALRWLRSAAGPAAPPGAPDGRPVKET